MAKNIVICLDGTGRKFSENKTNVVHTAALVTKNKHQIVCYDPGVGTFDFLGKTRRKGGMSLLLGKTFGYGVKLNILDGYKFLMRHYEPGDQVFLFGFSRGAYTARALAGMLYKCGLLENGCYNLLPSVSELYHTHNNDALAAQFKAIFSQECKPHFIGVWDTVKSLGYFLGKSFFNTRLNPDIKFAYQAISIDENRKKFQVCLWDETAKAPTQTIEQVWFSGSHSDVGGWYEERGLSDISLAWLLQKVQNQGLLLEDNWQQTLNLNPLAPMHESRKGVWKLWRPVTRQIPEQALIHQSVIEGMERQAKYRPELPSMYTVVD